MLERDELIEEQQTEYEETIVFLGILSDLVVRANCDRSV